MMIMILNEFFLMCFTQETDPDGCYSFIADEMSCSSFEERVASLEAFVTLWRVAGEIESSRKKVRKKGMIFFVYHLFTLPLLLLGDHHQQDSFCE